MKLHEILAIEKQSLNQVAVLFQDTLNKFGKEHFFRGWIKRLKMIADTPMNAAIEDASSETREVVTTVSETLNYFFETWAKAEDIQYRKNLGNQHSMATINIGNELNIPDVPVDELMGLETRLTKIRELFTQIPTFDATKNWIDSNLREGVLRAQYDDVTTKTEKILTPVVLYEATKEHPAQVKEVSRDEIVGKFTTTQFTGAVSSWKKAEAIKRVEQLLDEIKKARMRANCVEVPQGSIASQLVNYIMKPLTK